MPRQSAFIQPAPNGFGPHSLSRVDRTLQSQPLMLLNGVDPVTTTLALSSQRRLDFATQDYLGLSAHPALHTQLQAADADATGEDHSTRENPALSASLRSRLSGLLRLPATALFSSGAQATRRTLSVLLSPDDDVLVAAGSPTDLRSAILATGARLHLFPAGSIVGVERRLARLSRQTRNGRLVLATAAVSDTDARLANLADLAALAQLYQALLVVDCTHDFGTMGQGGSGLAEPLHARVAPDVIIGGFHASFAAVEGFAAFRDPDLAARMPQAGPPAGRCRLILKAIDIAFGPEGRVLRHNLHGLAVRLRNHLMADGIRSLGGICLFVPIPLPPVTALPRTALMESTGTKVTLLMPPVVPLHAPRWRITLSAKHTAADIDDLARLIRDVNRTFDRRSALVPLGA